MMVQSLNLIPERQSTGNPLVDFGNVKNGLPLKKKYRRIYEKY
jgi:hypothetical protein